MFRLSEQKMAQRIAHHDWSGSPLGPLEQWPMSLRTLLNLMLSSRFPMFAAWGPDLVFLYNDAYAPMLGEKEPRALGRRFADVWDDIWSDILPLVDSALAGRATWMENLPITMRRNGYPEATHWTFSYSAAHDDAGKIAGMFCACQETTASVEAERMLRQREETLAEALEAKEALLEEKDVLLAEVNHRVKNSLQLVVSALSLQSRRIEDPATKAAFAQAITRVRAITSVHERLYRSGDPLVVDMKSYLEGLADDLVATPEFRTRMQVAVEPVTMRTERAIPLAIIVNELVTNSLKYAYPVDRPGPIVLSLRRVDDDMLELTVADQGVGMLAKEETGGGLGTKLVATMASQLGATVERRATGDRRWLQGLADVSADRSLMPLSVLIVEDEMLLALDLEDILVEAGYRVVGNAVDMHQAVATCEAHGDRIDVAVMDVHLARGTNGVETARILRQRWGIPSLFVSGNLDDKTRARALESAPVGFVGKPFSERAVLDVLANVAKGHSET